jgi:hypothetical protein
MATHQRQDYKFVLWTRQSATLIHSCNPKLHLTYLLRFRPVHLLNIQPAQTRFIALILYRVMRQRLRAADAKTSPEKALAQLRRIQHHRITLNGTQPNTGLSTTSTEQANILAALNLTKPRLPKQLTLL